MTISQLFWEFDGRISRKLFILGSLFLLFLGGGLSLLLIPLFGLTVEDLKGTPNIKLLSFSMMMNALFFWPTIALGYKRMHDLGVSGKFYGFLNLVILLLYVFASFGVFSENPVQDKSFVAWSNILNLIFTVVFLVLVFARGTRGANSYGPDMTDAY